MVDNKRIVKNTMFLYFRMFLNMGVSLYTSRLVLAALGVENYGIYSVVGGVVVLFGFFNSAMSSATQRFLAIDIGKKKETNLRNTFNTAFAIHVGISIIVLLMAETIGLWFVNYKLNFPVGRMDEVNFVYQFSILASIIGITQVPFNALIIVRERMNIFAVVSVAETIFRLLIVFLLLKSPYSKLVSYSVLLFLITLVISSFYKIYCLRSFGESRFTLVRDRSLYRELISYSGWNLIGNVASVGKGQGVNMLLNLFFGTLVNAAYGIMVQVQTAVQSFVMNFQMAVNPQIYKLYAEGNLQQMQQLIFRSSKFSFFLLFVLVCPIVFNVDYLLIFWLKSPPEFSNEFVKFSLVNLLIECVSGALITGALASGKIKWYQIVVGSILLLNLPLSYLFFLIYDSPISFLYVSIVIALFTLIFRLFFLKRMIQLDLMEYWKKVLTRIVFVVLLSLMSFFLLNLLLGKAHSFLHLLGSSMVLMFVVSLIILLVGCTAQERSLVILGLKKIKGKFRS